MQLDFDVTHYLKKAFLFEDLPHIDFARILKGAKQLKTKAGRFLFKHGQKADYFYLIKSGAFSVFRFSPDGEEKIFQILKKGDLVAEGIMFMEPCTYPMYAKAIKDSVAIAILRENLLSTCQQSNQFSLKILAALSCRLYQSIDNIDHLTLNNASQRLVTYLLELSSHQNTNTITLPVPHAALAMQLNIAPETLSRLLQKFRQKSLITGRRGQIILKDADSLRQLVALPPACNVNLANNPSKQAHPIVCSCCNLG